MNPERKNLIRAVAGAWVGLGFIFAIQQHILSDLAGRPQTLSRLLLGVVPHYLLWSVLAVPIFRAATRWPLTSGRLFARVALHCQLALLFYVADAAVSAVIMPPLLHDPTITPLMMRMATVGALYDDFLFYWAMVGASHLIQYQRTLVREQTRMAELQRSFALARLSALRSQLQPHFLFNTLNAIMELMHVDIDAAERMTGSLSDLLRSSLEIGEREEIPFTEEMEILERYLDIQRVRFSDSVTIVLSIDDAALDALVPPLMLQPLVENAFRHGLSQRVSDGRIEIIAARNGGSVTFEVCDNGGKLPAAGVQEGIGLRNTRVRLEHLYGADASLKIEPVSSGGARVVINIPYRDADVAATA